VRELNAGGNYMQRAMKPEDVTPPAPRHGHGVLPEVLRQRRRLHVLLRGAFEVEDVAPLAAQYLGALPSSGKRASTFVDRGLGFPKTPSGRGWKRAWSRRARPRYLLRGHGAEGDRDVPRTRRGQRAAQPLRDLLREELSGTYGAPSATPTRLRCRATAPRPSPSAARPTAWRSSRRRPWPRSRGCRRRDPPRRTCRRSRRSSAES
jgi:hypothetical protein